MSWYHAIIMGLIIWGLIELVDSPDPIVRAFGLALGISFGAINTIVVIIMTL